MNTLAKIGSLAVCSALGSISLPAQILTCHAVSDGITFEVVQYPAFVGPYVLTGSVPMGQVVWWGKSTNGQWQFVPGWHRQGWHGLAFPGSTAEASLRHDVTNGTAGDDLVLEFDVLARPTPNLGIPGVSGLIDIDASADLVIEVVSDQPVTCGVQLAATVTTGPPNTNESGSASVHVDLDDDGSDDFGLICNFYCTMASDGADVIELGPTPRTIRVRGYAGMAGATYVTAAAHLELRISPRRAGVAPFGLSCSTVGWTPVLDAVAGSLPQSGAVLGLEVHGLPTANPPLVFGCIGVDDQTTLGLPLPLDLAPFGMPGCIQYLDPLLDQIVAVPVAGGVGAWNVPIPLDPGFVGLEFFAQTLVTAPGANAAGLVTSNAVRAVIGI